MDLWIFLTVSVIVWGIVELVQVRSTNKLLKKMDSDEDESKMYRDRIERLERRVANLEAIVVDEESGRSASSGGSGTVGPEEEHVRHEPGTMANKLR